MESTERLEYIWLEVSNVALSDVGKAIEVQLKGDHETDRWLRLKVSSESLYKSLIDAMKDKRPIHAKLAPDSDKSGKRHLVIEDLRVMFAATSAR